MLGVLSCVVMMRWLCKKKYFLDTVLFHFLFRYFSLLVSNMFAVVKISSDAEFRLMIWGLVDQPFGDFLTWSWMSMNQACILFYQTSIYNCGLWCFCSFYTLPLLWYVTLLCKIGQMLHVKQCFKWHVLWKNWSAMMFFPPAYSSLPF